MTESHKPINKTKKPAPIKKATVTKTRTATTSKPITAAQVAGFLKKHADFFIKHQDLLEQLRIPHPTHERTVSLIERRLQLLETGNHRLKSQLSELIHIARDNDHLSALMQKLTLSLLEATDLADIIHIVTATMRDDFNADFVTLRLAAACTLDGLNDVLIQNDHLNEFEDYFRMNRPLCGRLSLKQAELLFPANVAEVASAVVMPLRGVGWRGILALGSRETQRYHAELGTLFLVRIAQILVASLNPWLATSILPARRSQPRKV